MRLDWLRAFRAVMQTGTTTGAAAILLRTQPQISRMITHLEKTLRLDLFSREGRRLVPTQAGLSFFRYVEPLLIGLDGVVGAADDIRQSRGRPVVVGAEPFLLHALLPEAVSFFHQEQAGWCSIDMCVRGLGVWMAHANADLGVVALPFPQTDMQQIPFAEADVVAVLPPGHAQASKPTIEMSDLAASRFIALSPTTLLRAQIDAAAARTGVSIKPVLEAASGVTACELVARGLGATVADPIVARSFLERGVSVHALKAGLHLSYGYLLPIGRPASHSVLQLMNAVASSAARLGGTQVRLLPPWNSAVAPAAGGLLGVKNRPAP